MERERERDGEREREGDGEREEEKIEKSCDHSIKYQSSFKQD